MKKRSSPIMRRSFLKSGLTGGAFLVLGVKNFFSSSASLSECRQNDQGRCSDSAAGKLREIAAKYGSEFGDIKTGF